MEDLITKCDAVVNFAAESFVDRSIENADPFLVSNIRGAFTLLDIVTKQKKRLLQISTDEVFGSLSSGTATEQSTFNPSNPYAATKAAAELLIKSYVNTYDSDVIITRCTNNYGPCQFYEKLIPKTIILANQNKKIPIYGQGTNIRDWIYVDDHIEALKKCLFDGNIGESYCIGGDNEISNLNITELICSFMNQKLSWDKPYSSLITFVEDRLGHDYRYSIDSSKIKKELNWRPSFEFENALKNTVQWYLDNKNWLLNKI